MRIIKKFQGAVPENRILNTHSNNTTDTYSCDYINKFQTYSTVEQIIGIWIDGKPLYRKTLEFTPNTDTTVNLGISNIDKIWIDESHSFIDASNETISLNQYATDGYTRAWINKTNGLRFKTSWNIADRTGYLTVLYTKTTD